MKNQTISHDSLSAAAEPVRRLLLRLISRGGPEPVRLPSERELAEKLGVSRVTVRQAIAELDDYIIRIPGRKGAFGNPKFSKSAGEFFIGLVVKDCVFPLPWLRMFGGLSEEFSLREYRANLNIIDMSFRNNLSAQAEIELSNFDILLWESSFRRKLIPDSGHSWGIPSVEFSFYLPGPDPAPTHNFFGFDHRSAGRGMAEFFLKHGCSSIFFASNDLVKFAAMREEMQKNGGTARMLTEGECAIDLPPRKSFDAVAATGNPAHISRLLEALEKQNFTGPVLLQPGTENYGSHPRLRLFRFAPEAFDDACRELGRRIASGMCRLLSESAKEIPTNENLICYRNPQPITQDRSIP